MVRDPKPGWAGMCKFVGCERLKSLNSKPSSMPDIGTFQGKGFSQEFH